MPPPPTRRQPRPLRAAPRWRVGRLGGPPRCRGDRRARRRRPRGAGPPGSDPRAPRPRRRGGSLWSASGRLLRAGTARPQLRGGRGALERSRRGCGQGRVRRLRRRVGIRSGRHTRSTSLVSDRSSSRWLEGRSDPMSWKADADAHPVVDDPAVTRWEQAASLGAREVEKVVIDIDADAVLAGAGVANLAAWVAVGRAQSAGRPRDADGRARALGVRADSRRPVHLQPAGLPGHAVPLRCVDGPGHGHRRPCHDHRRAVSVRPRSTATGP